MLSPRSNVLAIPAHLLASLSLFLPAAIRAQQVEGRQAQIQAALEHAMVYDSVRHVTVCVSGRAEENGGNDQNDDSWEWNGSNWTQRHATGPTARIGHAMTFDASPGVTVLHGGYTIDDSGNGETWEWDGTAWTLRSEYNPYARMNAAMVYDSARHAELLFGGYTFNFSYSGETWTRDILCSADFNFDHTIDLFDYLDFVQMFAANSPAADFNGRDGIINIDYLDFIAALSAGCS